MPRGARDGPHAGRLIAIGNFDGVHIGHVSLLGNVIERAAERGIIPTVLTFDPHPAAVLGRGAPRMLTRLERKLELLRAIGPELDAIVVPFDRALSASSPREFAARLRTRHDAEVVLVGENFRFGKDRAGNLSTLERLGAEFGFDVNSAPLLHAESDVVSSSRIRAAIEQGRLDVAASLLGRPHRLTGSVVRGRGRGRGLGFPTANLAAIEELLPATGVYSVHAWLSGERHPAVSNVGIRPTFRDGELTVEVHLLDQERDLGGLTLSIDLVSRIRDERRFENPDDLRAQIQRDVDAARERLGSRPASG
jgi:riboflavin kinase/FMN adenylyltransferase